MSGVSTDIVDPSTLDGAARSALARLILTLADSKRLMGLRYSDWLLGAPSIETGIACSSMAQDEWGHARLLYAMLKELGHDPVKVEHDRGDAEYASIDGLDTEPEGWAELVVRSALVDEALRVRLEGFAEGGFELARSRVPKMLAEEELHRDFAVAWMNRLAGLADARERVGAEVSRVLPRTLAWLEADDEATAALVAAGLSAGPAELVERYLERIGPLLERAGLAASAPDRSDWDGARARGPGYPDAEALERARGDRNRDLFVE